VYPGYVAPRVLRLRSSSLAYVSWLEGYGMHEKEYLLYVQITSNSSCTEFIVINYIKTIVRSLNYALNHQNWLYNSQVVILPNRTMTGLPNTLGYVMPQLRRE